MTNQQHDPAQVAAERISRAGRLAYLDEVADIIRHAYAEHPRPAIQERAEAAAEEIAPGMWQAHHIKKAGEIITRHFSDLEPDAELREAAQYLIQNGAHAADCAYVVRPEVKRVGCDCGYEHIRAALERSKQ